MSLIPSLTPKTRKPKTPPRCQNCPEKSRACIEVTLVRGSPGGPKPLTVNLCLNCALNLHGQLSKDILASGFPT